MLRLPRRGKGQALSAAERAAPPGHAAARRRRPRRRPAAARRERRRPRDRALRLAQRRRLRDREAGRRRAARPARCRASTRASRCRASARSRRPRARACFPLAPGFGCEVRDDDRRRPRGPRRSRGRAAARAIARPGATSRGFLHRGRQLPTRCSRAGPLRVNHRGAARCRSSAGRARRRTRRSSPRSASPTTSGRAPSAASRAHLRAGRTTGVLKLVGIPLVGLVATRRALGRAARRPRREPLEPARHEAGPRAQGVPRAATPLPARPLAVAVLPRSLRSPRDGDARRRRVERAGGAARVEFRGPAHGPTALAGDRERSPPSTSSASARSLGALIERTPVLRELDARAPRVSARSDEVRLRHRRRRLVARQGHHRGLARAAAEGARAEGAGAEVRPVHQRRPGHDEPVPARRGVRHRGRRRDRPRHRPLRALHRREPLPAANHTAGGDLGLA